MNPIKTALTASAIVCVLAVLVMAGEPGTRASTYTNPVGNAPIHMGDPFVLQHDGKYYLFGTTSPNDGFQYWESTDLMQWNLKGYAYKERTHHGANRTSGLPRSSITEASST